MRVILCDNTLQEEAEKKRERKEEEARKKEQAKQKRLAEEKKAAVARPTPPPPNRLAQRAPPSGPGHSVSGVMTPTGEAATALHMLAASRGRVLNPPYMIIAPPGMDPAERAMYYQHVAQGHMAAVLAFEAGGANDQQAPPQVGSWVVQHQP